MWLHKALFESYFYNMLFNFFNCYRRLVNTKHTCAFAWCGTDTSCEFGTIVGRRKYVVRFSPALPVYSVFEFRNDIPQRTAVVTKLNTAIHTTRSLLVELL